MAPGRGLACFFQTLQNVQSEFLSIIEGGVGKTWSALHAHVQGDHLLTNEEGGGLARHTDK